MWKLGSKLILCLLLLGVTKAKAPAEVTKEQDIEKGYAFLDNDDNSEGDYPELPLENGIPDDDDDDYPLGEPDDDELPAVDVTDEAEDDDDVLDDDDDDDDDDDVKYTWKGKNWRGKDKKHKRWERKQKKEESGKGQRKRYWRKNKREKSEDDEDRREGFSDSPSHLPLKRFVSKIARIVDKKVDKPVPPRIFYKKSKAKVYDDEDEDDDMDEEVEDLYATFPHPHGGRGHRRGRHHGRKPHGGKHHHGGRKPHWRPHHGGRHHGKPATRWTPGKHFRFHSLPVDKRVAIMCVKIQKEQHVLYMHGVNERLQKGIGNVERKSYRVEFAGKMKQCCNNTDAVRMECFVALTRERYDNFCDRNMPLKPWSRGSPRHEMKAQLFNSTCCHLTGEERYACFNKTMEMLHQVPHEGLIPEEVEEEGPIEPSDAEVEEILNEDDDDDEDMEDIEEEDEEDELVNSRYEFPGRRGRKGRKHHRGHHHKGRFVRHVKRKCCHAGREAGRKIHDKDIRVECVAGGAKYAKHSKAMKAVCGIFYSRCCIHTANRTREIPATPPVFEEPIPKYFAFTEEDDIIDEEDFNDEEDIRTPTIVHHEPIGDRYPTKKDRYSWKKKSYDDNKHRTRGERGRFHDQMID